MTKKPSGSFYRHILADAWSVVKKGKSLWILGFFVSFLGNGGVYELLVQGTGRLGLRENFGGLAAAAALLPSGADLIATWKSLGTSNAVTVLLLGIAGLALLVIAVWVIVASQGGLILGVRDQHKGRKLSFNGLLTAGGELFWPLFSLNVLSRVVITVFFYLLLSFMVLLLTDVTLWSSLLYLVAFLILVPLTLIVGFVTIYAAGYVAIQRLPFLEAVGAAIALFRTYWLISLETALILFGINILAALALGASMLSLMMLFLPFIIIAGLIPGGIGVWLIMFLGIAAAVTLLVLVGSGLAAFQYSVWTLLFLKLHQRGHGGVSKIVRFFHRLLG